MLTTIIVFRDEFFNNASFNAKYEYAAVGPEYLNPACGEMHAFGILLVVLVVFVSSVSASALCKNLVNSSSNSSLSDEYHEPAFKIGICRVRYNIGQEHKNKIKNKRYKRSYHDVHV